jgi:chromosome partitioning protein
VSQPLPRRAKVITSLNLKGGVGKTHACWLIAGVCQERGKKCLVVDLDKQGNISTTLAGDDISSPGADQFFNPAVDAQISDLIRATSLSHVDLIPATFQLERYNQTDPAEWQNSGLHAALVEPLREISPFYDYVLLDCPADISLITYAALCASDFLLVPLEAAQWGALGTQHVLETLRHVQAHQNARLQLLGFLVSRYKRVRKYQQAYLTELRRHFRADAFKTVIPDYAPFEQAVNDRIPIVLHSPTSHAAAIARRFFDECEARSEALRARGRPGRGQRLPERKHSLA